LQTLPDVFTSSEDGHQKLQIEQITQNSAELFFCEAVLMKAPRRERVQERTNPEASGKKRKNDGG